MKPGIYLLLLPLMGAASATAGPREVSARLASGEQRVALVELYTSEGCSSCPPADRWLSGLAEDPGLWTTFVPVAFHVDYWDYIGWQDRFARPAFSARQRQYAIEGGTSVVYTPGVFVQGADWRGWRNARPPAADRMRVGKLSVTIDDGRASVRFDAVRADDRELTAHIALLGMDLSTPVRAGENSGRTLHHDFVALETASAPLVRTVDGYTATLELPDVADAPGLALAAWVSAHGAQKPVQSVGGYLARP